MDRKLPLELQRFKLEKKSKEKAIAGRGINVKFSLRGVERDPINSNWITRMPARLLGSKDLRSLLTAISIFITVAAKREEDSSSRGLIVSLFEIGILSYTSSRTR